MLERVQGIQYYEVPIGGGIDELCATSKIKFGKFIKMVNWRVSPDGERIEKRDGLTSVRTHTGDTRIFGYATYYDSDDAFCELCVTENKIWRKVGAGSNTAIHTFSSAISHPVRILEAQGKMFIITDVDNRMVHTNKADYQVGITAPTTLPTLALDYSTIIFEEDMADISDWDDDDYETGVSSQVTYDSKSCMKLTVVDEDDVARRSLAATGVGKRYKIEFSVRFDDLEDDAFHVRVYNGENLFHLLITGLNPSYFYIENGGQIPLEIVDDTWYSFVIYVNAPSAGTATADVYINSTFYGKFSCGLADTTAADVRISVEEDGGGTNAYVDWFNLYTSTSSSTGSANYRYAVTYARGGNYGCESNAIKSLLGTVIFYGSGLNDMTVSGEYTGAESKSVQVVVSSAGTPDLIDISFDGGQTWSIQNLPMGLEVPPVGVPATVEISYGIILTFESPTGHTATDMWAFTPQPCSISRATDENVTLSSIPVSSDLQVTQRKIYRTVAGGATFYWLATIENNTTTTFIDTALDSALGDELADDHDVAPNGKYSCWWDNRLWILDDDTNILYYSNIRDGGPVPEEFDIGERIIPFSEGKTGDKATGMIPFLGRLYVFMRGSIFAIIKAIDGTYGRYLIRGDLGCVAPWSLVEADGYLMFVSYRGIERFDGENFTEPCYSLPVSRTVGIIDASSSKLELITACVAHKKTEVWFSFPDVTGSSSATTVVYNWSSKAFYLFQFHKVPSWIGEAVDSSGVLQVYVGTRDTAAGLFYHAGTQDGTTNITATLRFPWLKLLSEYLFKRFEAEFEAPTGITLSVSYYADMDKDAVSTGSMTGATPSATDLELRRPVDDYHERLIKAKYLSVGLTNAENVGAALKINAMILYYAPTHRKLKISPD